MITSRRFKVVTITEGTGGQEDPRITDYVVTDADFKIETVIKKARSVFDSGPQRTYRTPVAVFPIGHNNIKDQEARADAYCVFLNAQLEAANSAASKVKM